MSDRPPPPMPVEYAVAADRYLDSAGLEGASLRVYRISLATWAWPLVGRPTPRGRKRRGARIPVVPLALIDDESTPARLADFVAASRGYTSTLARELSVLRGAVGWWRERGWIRTDPTARLRAPAHPERPAAALTAEQAAEVFALRVELREHALWRLLYDSGAHVEDALGLDADRLDLRAGLTRPRHGRPTLAWGAATNRLLELLIAGRRAGPVFLTRRRAAAGTPCEDVCPVTKRARLSYRRAAELFTAATSELDPTGHGWTLHQLRRGRV